MADSVVTIKFSATEYRLLRNELELHVRHLEELTAQRGGGNAAVKARAQLRDRVKGLREILKEI